VLRRPQQHPTPFSHEIGGLLRVEAAVDKAFLDKITTLDIASAETLCLRKLDAFRPRDCNG